MDSKVVNKLIRSEVWPVLRQEGFSKFDTRRAWRYRGPFVDIVHFLSFNSYQAEGVGCTTFSFALNLGVYLLGGLYERTVKVEAGGSLRPHEPECPFRVNLKKRSAVDGYARDDIFYVAADGSTMSAVLAEVLFLLKNEALPWFGAFSNLGKVLATISDESACLEGTGRLGLGIVGARDSYATNHLLAGLKLTRHAQQPGEISAGECLEAIGTTIGGHLNTFSPGFNSPLVTEDGSRQMRDLLVRIRSHLIVPEEMPRSHPAQCELLGDNWHFDSAIAGGAVEALAAVSPRESLWPTLRELGFVEFTDRLAHRPNADSVEVIAFFPVAPAERRANHYPGGLFRIGAGIFWPKLEEWARTRISIKGHFRPRLQDCLLQMWLMPAERAAYGGPTCFDRVEHALSSLRNDTESWFSIWRDAALRRRLLEQPDWAILTSYPTMRGHGSAHSVGRALIRTVLDGESAAELTAGFAEARRAVESYPPHLKPRFLNWVERVEASSRG